MQGTVTPKAVSPASPLWGHQPGPLRTTEHAADPEIPLTTTTTSASAISVRSVVDVGTGSG
jgi:hypothetical protein